MNFPAAPEWENFIYEKIFIEHTHIYMYIYMYIYLYMYKSIYIYISICIYINKIQIYNIYI